MSAGLMDELEKELKQVRADIESQKHVLKRSIGNAVITQAAQQHLKELHTRMTVLETNRKKLAHASHLPSATGGCSVR
jgi:hypothetical protein